MPSETSEGGEVYVYSFICLRTRKSADRKSFTSPSEVVKYWTVNKQRAKSGENAMNSLKTSSVFTIREVDLA